MPRRPSPPRLTPTAGRVLEYIIRYKTANDGNSPTWRDIARAVGISSTSCVDYHIRRLECLGLIIRPGSTRGISVVGGQWTMKGNGNEQESER